MRPEICNVPAPVEPRAGQDPVDALGQAVVENEALAKRLRLCAEHLGDR